MYPRFYREDRMSYQRSTYKFERPISDLLKEQREGKQLSLTDRQRVTKYAEEQRKKNLKKKAK